MSFLRRFSALLLGSSILLVSACSGPSGESGADGAQSGSETRTVETEQGDVDVPSAPQRVVVLNYALAGYLYDLDVPVVATTPEVTGAEGEFSQFWSEKAEAQETEFLPWSNDGFDVEAIIAADPDLIIAGGIGFPLKHATDAYDQLKEVAPTVIVPGDKQTWQDQFSFIADDVLGRGSDYEKFESAYEDRAAEVRDTISVPKGEISILTLDSRESPYILIEGKSLAAELEPLGFTTAPLFEENDIEPYTAGGDMFGPSLEVLPDVLRSETVFVVGFNNADIGVDDLKDEAPYDRVPAFESGQVHDLPYWSMRADYDEVMALFDTIEDMFPKEK